MALKRELAAAVAIPIVLVILFLLPPIDFNLLVAVVSLAALWEFYRMAERTGYPVAKTVGMLGGAAIVLAAAAAWTLLPFLLDMASLWPPNPLVVFLAFLMVSVLLASFAPLLAGVSSATALGGAATTVFGILSIPLPAVALCYLRSSHADAAADFGSRSILFLFLLVWGCDSAAYYGGRRFGRRKLASAVSPHKTVEGALSGLIGATLIGAAAGTWWVLPEFRPLKGALAGALASTAGQVGDLVESFWKRGAGVKDSGTFLPGHGGFYDRIDSLLYAGPMLAAFVATL